MTVEREYADGGRFGEGTEPHLAPLRRFLCGLQLADLGGQLAAQYPQVFFVSLLGQQGLSPVAGFEHDLAAVPSSVTTRSRWTGWSSTTRTRAMGSAPALTAGRGQRTRSGRHELQQHNLFAADLDAHRLTGVREGSS